MEKPKKSYRKVVPTSKWEKSTDLSETLKSLNLKEKNQKIT